MAMFRKSGGGFLNGVDGTIVNYAFGTKAFESKKGDDYHRISVELQVQQDGAEGPVTTYIDAGFFYPDQMAVSEDGRVVTSESSEVPLSADSDFAKFVESVATADPAIGAAIEATNGTDFSAMIGYRMRFVQNVDAEATAKFGKRKGRDGKAYNRTYLTVSDVYGKAEAKSGAKPAAKPTTAAMAKTSAKPATKGGIDLGVADAVLSGILASVKDGEVKISGIGSAVTRYSLLPANKSVFESVDRNALGKFLASEEYLSGAQDRNVVIVDREGGKLLSVEVAA